MCDKIVIYDGECTYCTMASLTVEKLDEDIGIKDWNSDFSQSFLEAQFDSFPFSVFFVDREEEKIWVGDSAIDMIAGQSNYTNPTRSIVADNYRCISSTISKLSGRDREIERSFDGMHKLTDDSIQVIKEYYD